MKKLNIFKKIFVIAILILSLGLFGSGILFGGLSYADTTPSDTSKATYTVVFKIKNTVYKTYKLNAGQKITKPTDEDIKDMDWKAQDSNTNFDFNTTTMPSQKLTLNLVMSNDEFPVIFYQKNPNYDSTKPSSDEYYAEYMGLDVKVVSQGATVAEYDRSLVPVEEGMECSGWTDVKDGLTAYNFETPISTLVVLYPMLQKKTYTLTFVQYDGTEDKVSVRHGELISSVPAAKEQAGMAFTHWYRAGDATKAQVNFTTERFTSDETFNANYSENMFDIEFPENPYGVITGNEKAERGKSYTCTITLDSLYNQTTLTRAQVQASPTNYASMDIKATAAKGVFTCTFYQVSGPFSVSLIGLSKNKYNVNFTFDNAAGISVIPKPRTEGDYTQNGDRYTVEYEKSFYFTLELDARYESAYDNLNGNIGISSDDNTGFFGDTNGAYVSWSNQYNCYVVKANTRDSDISLNVPTVECITATITGVEYLDFNVGDASFDSDALVRWDDTGSSYVARIKKGQRFRFTAKVPDNDKDRYYLAGFSGDGISQNINVTNGFIINSTKDTEINFDVIETVFVTVPATITGAQLAFTTDVAESGQYNQVTGTWKYKAKKNGEFAITFTFTTEYSDAVPTISVGGAMSASVDMTEFATSKTIKIVNIDSESTITIEPLEKNKYTINYVSNDMATITPYDGYTNVALYGDELKAKIVKKDAYSNAVLADSNITFTSKKYSTFEIEYIDGEEEQYYILTIKTIVGAFTVSIDELTKNSYLIQLIGNEFAELTTTNDHAQYDGRFVCSYTLGAAYSKASVSQENISVKNKNNETPTVTITVNTTQKTITIEGIMSELEVSIQNLAKNTYTVAAGTFRGAEGYTSSKNANENVAHGSSFVFDITFDDNYSQNVAKFMSGELSLTYSTNNGDYVDLAPSSQNGNTLRYEIYNISGNISFVMGDISVNKYTVIFYDTDPVKEIYRYNAVVHGRTITEPTRPVKEGYVFTGWYFDEQGTTQFTSFSAGIGQDLTLYARYNSQTFTVTFVDYNARTGKIDNETVKTVSYGKPVIINTPSAKPGYSKSWWVIPEGANLNSVKQDYRILAEYEIDKYTVTFFNDKIIHEKQTVEYNSKATTPTENPRKQGYTFVRWNFDFVSTPITADTNIYAEYKINTYTVRFVNATQGNSLLASFPLEYESKVNTPEEAVNDNGDIIRGKYIFTYGDEKTIEHQLSDGYVLEGWYADAGLSVRYNFDNPIKGDTTIYGNMYISKVSIKFNVDGVMYIEKQVDYNNSLIAENIPAIPRKEGYTQKTPIWTIRDLSDEDVNSYDETKIAELQTEFTNSMNTLTNDIKIYALYRINTYRVTFKLPDGTTLVREVYHGGTVTNVPVPDTSFGEVVVMDSNLYRYVTADTIVYITIIDFLPFMMVAGASCVLAFVVISLAIAIKNMRRGIRNIKNMENLFKAIKQQDARLTSMNEEKLRAQVAEQMKEKEKYKRNNFLDN